MQDPSFPTDEMVRVAAEAIQAAELSWKAENGGDAVSCLECPDDVKARAALTAALAAMWQQLNEDIERNSLHAAESKRVAPDSWGAAYDEGYLSGLEHVQRMFAPTQLSTRGAAAAALAGEP